METCLLFLDLVECFNKVPRDLLWLVLARYGAPPKLITLLKVLHNKVDVQFEVNRVMRTFLSCIGVKQGDVLGPELFAMFMAAVMETWGMASKHKLCMVKTKNGLQLRGDTQPPRPAKNGPRCNQARAVRCRQALYGAVQG